MSWSVEVSNAKALFTAAEAALVVTDSECVRFDVAGTELGRAPIPDDFEGMEPDDDPVFAVANDGTVVMSVPFMISHAGDTADEWYVWRPDTALFEHIPRPENDEFFGDEEITATFLDPSGRFWLVDIAGYDFEDYCPLCARYDFATGAWTSFLTSGGEDVANEEIAADGDVVMTISELDATLIVGSESATWDFADYIDAEWFDAGCSEPKSCGYALSEEGVWQFSLHRDPHLIVANETDAQIIAMFPADEIVLCKTTDGWRQLRLSDGATRSGSGQRPVSRFRLDGETLSFEDGDVQWAEWNG